MRPTEFYRRHNTVIIVSLRSQLSQRDAEIELLKSALRDEWRARIMDEQHLEAQR